jgi:uncharacterized protein (DUF433 family)
MRRKHTHQSKPTVRKTDHPHIVRVKGVCGGAPIVKGTRVPVRAIVTYHLSHGDTVETIAEQLPPLTLAQIHDALSYYYDHQSDIDEERRWNEDESHWRSYLQEHEVAIDASDHLLHAR